MATKHITLELTVREEAALSWWMAQVRDLQEQGVLTGHMGGYSEELGRINAALNAIR